jgi:hypothetical protein
VEKPLPTVSDGQVSAPIVVDIANDGTSSYHGLTTITLYGSPSRRFGRSAIQFQSVKERLHIAAGGSENVDITLGSAPSSLSGKFYIVAQVSGQRTTAQGVSRKTMDFPPFVDLTDAFNRKDTPVVQYTSGLTLVSLDMTLNVTNPGNQTVNGSLKTLVEISSSSNGANPSLITSVKSNIKIAPGQTEVLKFSKLGNGYQLPTGAAYFVAVTDPQNTFSETTLANNTAISTEFIFGQ